MQIIINDQIRFEKVRISNHGILSINEAKNLAAREGLDLILITEKADPPVCRLADIGKYKYELQKKEKESKKKQAESRIETKEIRLRPVTDKHDLQIKAKRISEFLKKGNQVKITMRFRGRELANKPQGEETFKKLIDMIDGLRYIKNKTFEGRALSATIAKGE